MRSELLRALHAPPITPVELLHSGSKAWPSQFLQKHRGGPSTLKIGICVSGGPDSMCLAYLLERIKHEQLLKHLNLDLTALIVDHQAREDSTEEAEHVSQLLKNLSIQSRILTLTWPRDINPSALSNFESRARDLRFDSLMRAAVENGLQRLFLGHHEDDQYETLLYRLRPKRGRLRTGIQPSSIIPLRSEIVSEMMESHPTILDETLAAGNFRSTLELSSPFSSSRCPGTNITPSRSLSIFPGLDITLHRPLLQFSKTRILATCATYGIPYITDPTNVDVSTTPRNAIRSMVATKTLPRALSKNSLINISKQAALGLTARKGETISMARAVEYFRWDLRSGTLVVDLPRLPGLVGSLHPRSSQHFLRRLLEAVTPLDRWQTRQQHTDSQLAGLDLYNESRGKSKAQQDTSGGGLTFNAAGCVLEPCYGRDDPSNNRYYDKLRIHRQAFKVSELTTGIRRFEISFEAKDHSSFWSRWLLWDNRYWISICCSSPQYLHSCIVRPLMRLDVKKLRAHLKSLSAELLHTFESMLADAAPGSVRYTVPVLEDGRGVRAFPTLDFVVPDAVEGDGGRAELISWRIMYKAVSREMMELVGQVGRESKGYQENAQRFLNQA